MLLLASTPPWARSHAMSSVSLQSAAMSSADRMSPRRQGIGPTPARCANMHELDNPRGLTVVRAAIGKATGDLIVAARGNHHAPRSSNGTQWPRAARGQLFTVRSQRELELGSCPKWPLSSPQGLDKATSIHRGLDSRSSDRVRWALTAQICSPRPPRLPTAALPQPSPHRQFLSPAPGPSRHPPQVKCYRRRICSVHDIFRARPLSPMAIGYDKPM